MINISFTSFISFFLHMMALVGIMLIGAVFILWPINDQSVSNTQKSVFGVFSIVAALLLFGFIQFSA